jgi:hypothetical protein
MTGSVMKNLRMFRKLCGDGGLANVVLATTMWSSSIDEKTALDREQQLQGRPDYWAKMVEKGSKIFRHDRGAESATEIIDYLISRKKTFVLDIQHQLVDQGRQFRDTAAGAEVQAEINKVAEFLKDELENLQKEMNDAISLRDRGYQQELDDMRSDIMRVLEKSKEDMEKLVVDKDKLSQQMEHEAELRRQEMAEREQEIRALKQVLAGMEGGKRPDAGTVFMQLHLMDQHKTIQDLQYQLTQQTQQLAALAARHEDRGCIVM